MITTQQRAPKQDVALVKHDLEIALANTKHDILKWMVAALALARQHCLSG